MSAVEVLCAIPCMNATEQGSAFRVPITWFMNNTEGIARRRDRYVSREDVQRSLKNVKTIHYLKNIQIQGETDRVNQNKTSAVSLIQGILCAQEILPTARLCAAPRNLWTRPADNITNAPQRPARAV